MSPYVMCHGKSGRKLEKFFLNFPPNNDSPLNSASILAESINYGESDLSKIPVTTKISHFSFFLLCLFISYSTT